VVVTLLIDWGFAASQLPYEDLVSAASRSDQLSLVYNHLFPHSELRNRLHLYCGSSGHNVIRELYTGSI
jgi:hypothetical protein